MEDLERRSAAEILRDRWLVKASLAETSMNNPNLSDIERAVEECKMHLYREVAHEMEARLGLTR